MAKTSMNLDENIAGFLCYLGVWLTGIIFYLMEKDNKTVRFHALQSFLTFLPLTILGAIFTMVGSTTTITYTQTAYGNFPSGVSQPFIVLWYIGWVIYIIMIILWLILMIKAYQGEKFKVPVVGDIAEKHA